MILSISASSIPHLNIRIYAYVTISYFTPPGRSVQWREVTEMLPVVKPIDVSFLPPGIVEATYPWAFEKSPCPVNQDNVDSWTEAERKRAEEGQVMQSVEELCDEVCFLYLSTPLCLTLSNLDQGHSGRRCCELSALQYINSARVRAYNLTTTQLTIHIGVLLSFRTRIRRCWQCSSLICQKPFLEPGKISVIA